MKGKEKFELEKMHREEICKLDYDARLLKDIIRKLDMIIDLLNRKGWSEQK